MSGTRIDAVFEKDNDEFYLLRTFMFAIAECKTEIYLDENLKPKRNLYAIDYLEGPEPLLSLTKSLAKSDWFFKFSSEWNYGRDENNQHRIQIDYHLENNSSEINEIEIWLKKFNPIAIERTSEETYDEEDLS